MNKKLILIGGGGHAKSCIDVILSQKEYEILGILDVKEKVGEKLLDFPIIGTDEDLEKYINEGYYFLITVGQIKTPNARITLFDKLIKLNAKIATVISPLAHISINANINVGTIVMHHAIINSEAHIGMNSIINTKALIEHDARIGSHCHISTGTIINGGVKVGDGTFIGSGTITREYIEIGDRCLISAGMRIMESVEDEKIVK